MLNIGLIIGSTRPNRFADAPAQWLLDGAARRKDFRLEKLDLREVNLPFLEEPFPPSLTNGVFVSPAAEAWRRRLGACDGFIATAAEYNHGPTAVLKNALDSAFIEWQRKPIAFVGYGGVGGARAIETLRGIAVNLQMAPIRAEVNIAIEPFRAVLMEGKSLDDYDYLARTRADMFDDLVWWARTLSRARAKLVNA